MKLGLYLRSGRGAAVLRAVVASGVEIAYVVTARDPALLDDGFDEISDIADVVGIHVCDAPPPGVDATHAIAAGWRQLIDHPNLVVLHDSLLPRYRGFAPLVTALVNGDEHVGVTALLPGDQPDTGPIVGQRTLEVDYPARIADVLAQVEEIYADMTTDVLTDWPRSGLRQHERDATYSVWRGALDYRIDWSLPATRIRRLVDAVSWPYPGALTNDGTLDVTVRVAVEVPDVTIEDRRSAVGKVLRLETGGPVVVCGEGLLQLTDTFPFEVTSLRTRFQ